MSDGLEPTDPPGEKRLAPGVVSDEAPKSEELVSLKRRPLWPLFAAFLAVAAIVGGAVYWFTTRPDPFKVLVAIDVDGQWWEGSRPAATLADEIGEGLKRIGFEPVRGGDPEVDKILSTSKTPEEAARRLRAGFLITGSLSPELIEHKIQGETLMEARSDTKLQVRFIGDRSGKAEDVPVAANGYGSTKQEALAVLSDSIAESVFDIAVPKIVEHEVIKSQLEKGDITTVSRLQKAKDYVELRARRLDKARKAYAKADEDHVRYSGDPSHVTYHGSFSELDYLAGADGDRVLILTANVSPFIHPVSMELGWKYQLETLAWRGADGKDDVVWRGYHVMGFPTVSPRAADIALVEDLFGRAKTVSLVHGTAAERLRVDKEARYEELTMSRGSSFIAFTERPCRRDCVDSFSVVAVADGKSVYARNASDERSAVAKESYFGFDWLDDHQVVLAVRDNRPAAPADPPESDDGSPSLAGDVKRSEELRVIDVSKTPPLERLVSQLDSDATCYSPAASPDGKQFVLVCAARLVLFDAVSGDQTSTDELGLSPAWSPDGSKIAFVRDGDIFVMNVRDKHVTQLTKNDFPENRPMFSSDGKRVYFQSQQQDPNIETRLTSVVASVEVP